MSFGNGSCSDDGTTETGPTSAGRYTVAWRRRRRTVEDQRQRAPALAEQLPDLLGRTCLLDRAEPVEQGVVEHPCFHPGQVCGDAQVRAVSERQMEIGVRASDVVRPRVLEDLGVAVAGVEEQVHPLPGPDRHTPDLGVLHDGAHEAACRRGPPQRLLHRAVEQRPIGAQLSQLLGVLGERERHAGQQRSRRVTATGQEQAAVHEQQAVGQRRPVQLGGQQGRDQVLARVLSFDLELSPEEVIHLLELGDRLAQLVGPMDELHRLQGVAPAADLLIVPRRQADEVLGHLDGQRRGHLVDELDGLARHDRPRPARGRAPRSARATGPAPAARSCAKPPRVAPCAAAGRRRRTVRRRTGSRRPRSLRA